MTGPHIAEYVVELVAFVALYWAAGHTARHVVATARLRRRMPKPPQPKGRPQ